MNELISISLIALSLTFDTFAVTVGLGVNEQKMKFTRGVKIAFVLGIMQGLMPVLGWFAGETINRYINFGSFIAAGLLFFVAGKMFYESIKKQEDSADRINEASLWTIFLLGIATSIDAALVGVSFAYIDINVRLAAFVIFAFTFLVAMIGMLVGKKTSGLISQRSGIVGALVLLGIGIKVLIENL